MYYIWFNTCARPGARHPGHERPLRERGVPPGADNKNTNQSYYYYYFYYY